MTIKKITKLYYSKITQLSFKNWEIYSKLLESKPKEIYKKKGYDVVKLSKKNTIILQKLFSNIKFNFRIESFHFDKIKKKYSFNRLKFNSNQEAKRLQSMVTDYLIPKKKTMKILKPIFKEIIDKTQSILNSKIIINKIMIERNKPESLIKLKEILKKNKVKNQSKNVYLNAYGFHKDKLPNAFKKILVYPFPAGIKSGTTILKGYDNKIKVMKFEKGAQALVFDNSEVTHKGVLADKVRYIIQITFYQKSKKIKTKKENYNVEKITNSNYPLLTPSKVNNVIDFNNLLIKKMYSKIEKDLFRTH